LQHFRLIGSSTIALVPADFETSARNANALPPCVQFGASDAPPISVAKEVF
jgi:hypothetical protein